MSADADPSAQIEETRLVSDRGNDTGLAPGDLNCVAGLVHDHMGLQAVSN